MQRTRIRLGAAVLALGLVAACGENDFERAAVGASIGGVGSALTGGSAVKGAVVGGAAGALCDDVNLC